MTKLAVQAANNLEAVRSQKPLIHNITNYVVMNTTANALLSMGASPVMATLLMKSRRWLHWRGPW